MISHIAMLLLPMGLALVSESDTVPKPVYTCNFDAGQIVIEQPSLSGDVIVEVRGQARRYVMDKQKLVPRDQGMPLFRFQPDMKRWQWLDNQGHPLESVVCTEKPELKTG